MINTETMMQAHGHSEAVIGEFFHQENSEHYKDTLMSRDPVMDMHTISLVQ